jgi:hypothetical protein
MFHSNANAFPKLRKHFAIFQTEEKLYKIISERNRTKSFFSSEYSHSCIIERDRTKDKNLFSLSDLEQNDGLVFSA